MQAAERLVAAEAGGRRRRGSQAATRWLRETGSSELRVPYTFITPKE